MCFCYMQVGFCNLIKKDKDHTNHVWVADANENSTYYLKFDSPKCCHLRNAANSVRRWATDSTLVCTSWNSTASKPVLHGSISYNDTLFLFFLQIVEKLKEKVVGIVGNCKA